MEKIREAVGIFDSEQKLQSAIFDLSINGFERYEISTLASETAIRKELCTTHPTSKLLADNLKTPRVINIAPEEIALAEGGIISIGILGGVAITMIVIGEVEMYHTVIATLAGGIIGAIIGSILAKFFDNAYKNRIYKQIKDGGLILWVRTIDKKKESIARKILKNHGANFVHIHSL